MSQFSSRTGPPTTYQIPVPKVEGTKYFHENCDPVYRLGRAMVPNPRGWRNNGDESYAEQLHSIVSTANESILMKQRCEEIHENFKRYCIEMMEGPNMGLGIFALHDIPASTPIAYYNGTLSLIPRNEARHTRVGTHAITMGNGFFPNNVQMYLDAAFTPERPGRAQILNHKCPNCANCIMEHESFDDDKSGMGLEVVYTKTNIPAGTFLWYSYGQSYFPNRGFGMYDCCTHNQA